MGSEWHFTTSLWRTGALDSLSEEEVVGLCWHTLAVGIREGLVPPSQVIAILDLLVSKSPATPLVCPDKATSQQVARIALSSTVLRNPACPVEIRIRRLAFLSRLVGLEARTRLEAITRAAELADESGRAETAFELAQEQRSLATELGDRRTSISADVRIAMMRYFRGNGPGALADLNRILADLHDDELEARGVVLGNMGIVLKNAARYDEAIESTAQAERINRKRGASDLVCSNMLTRANMLKHMREYEACLELSELKDFAALLGRSRLVAMAIGTAANVQSRMGKEEEAVNLYLEAAKLFADVEDERNYIITRSNLAVARYFAGETDLAAAELSESADAAVGSGLRGCAMASLCALADLQLDRRDYESAHATVLRLEELESLGATPHDRIQNSLVKSRLLLAQDKPNDAVTVLRGVMKSVPAADLDEDFAAAQSMLARASFESGNPVEAIELASLSFDLAERVFPPDVECMLHSGLTWARSAQLLGDGEEVARLVLDMKDLQQRLEPTGISSKKLHSEVTDFLANAAGTP